MAPRHDYWLRMETALFLSLLLYFLLFSSPGQVAMASQTDRTATREKWRNCCCRPNVITAVRLFSNSLLSLALRRKKRVTGCIINESVDGANISTPCRDPAASERPRPMRRPARPTRTFICPTNLVLPTTSSRSLCSSPMSDLFLPIQRQEIASVAARRGIEKASPAAQSIGTFFV